MKFDALGESGRHLGASGRLQGGILEALVGSWVVVGGIWDPLGHPWGRAPGWWVVKGLSGEAIRGPNQQDTNQPGLLIPDQQLDSTPDWQTGNWRLEKTGLENIKLQTGQRFFAAWWPLTSRGRRIVFDAGSKITLWWGGGGP